MDAITLAAEIVQVQAQLAQLGAAILARADPTTKSYRLDTGQSTQAWEGNSIAEMPGEKFVLLEFRAWFQQRCSLSCLSVSSLRFRAPPSPTP